MDTGNEANCPVITSVHSSRGRESKHWVVQNFSDCLVVSLCVFSHGNISNEILCENELGELSCSGLGMYSVRTGNWGRLYGKSAACQGEGQLCDGNHSGWDFQTNIPLNKGELDIESFSRTEVYGDRLTDDETRLTGCRRSSACSQPLGSLNRIFYKNNTQR